MRLRLPPAALLLSVLIPLGTAAPAEAQSPAQDYQYGQGRFRQACRPPLKFAAGACVRRCPAGYRDTGRTCRFKNMNR
ncbi:hypothetical protein [Methylobacterium sp. J-068]|uniref:hypothetical protein n=1 Tax=Methylobacterium sp. J-068 TaxID=2836649 RepID=UPI001FB9D727|nr:hypothetical protein [Methylobacterium sp. J-068]MCJ2036999.1 hypothetical protein [Methylobacterium sp. J-068]